MRLPALRPAPMEARSTSTALPADSCRRNPPSAKYESTRTPSPRNSTSSATGALRSSPSRAPTKLHGMIMANGNDSAFNSLNTFVTSEPPYYSTFFLGNVSGSFNSRASWFLSGFRRDNDANSIINAQLLDPTGGSLQLRGGGFQSAIAARPKPAHRPSALAQQHAHRSVTCTTGKRAPTTESPSSPCRRRAITP